MSGTILRRRDRTARPPRVEHYSSAVNMQRFASALAPRTLVPIHSLETGRFAEFFANVVQKEDGIWWQVRH